MSGHLGVVLDTNVFVSAFILRKSAYELVEAWLEGKFLWILSPEIKEEYFEVISRPKFAQTKEEVKTFKLLLEYLITEGTVEEVIPHEKLAVIRRDPKDNKFVECAVTSHASFIVSGDKHLLDQKQYEGILILSPRQFLEELRKR